MCPLQMRLAGAVVIVAQDAMCSEDMDVCGEGDAMQDAV